MLKPSCIGLSVAIFFGLQSVHAESSTNKCTDGKRITYANSPCEKLGLKSIGPVRDTVIVVPGIQRPMKAAAGDSTKEHEDNTAASEVDVSESGTPGAGKINPVIQPIE